MFWHRFLALGDGRTVIFGFAVYFVINLYLWSLPISHEMLCIVTAPLGILYFIGFMWGVMRTTSGND